MVNRAQPLIYCVKLQALVFMYVTVQNMITVYYCGIKSCLFAALFGPLACNCGQWVSEWVSEADQIQQLF